MDKVWEVGKYSLHWCFQPLTEALFMDGVAGVKYVEHRFLGCLLIGLPRHLQRAITFNTLDGQWCRGAYAPSQICSLQVSRIVSSTLHRSPLRILRVVWRLSHSIWLCSWPCVLKYFCRLTASIPSLNVENLEVSQKDSLHHHRMLELKSVLGGIKVT